MQKSDYTYLFPNQARNFQTFVCPKCKDTFSGKNKIYILSARLDFNKFCCINCLTDRDWVGEVSRNIKPDIRNKIFVINITNALTCFYTKKNNKVKFDLSQSVLDKFKLKYGESLSNDEIVLYLINKYDDPMYTVYNLDPVLLYGETILSQYKQRSDRFLIDLIKDKKEYLLSKEDLERPLVKDFLRVVSL